MKAFDVVVVGELNVDLILNKIHGQPQTGKEILADEMTLTLGSSSAIFAANLSALGSQVAFIGKIGADSFGDTVRASLESKMVNTDMVVREPNLATGATIVLNYGEDRAMVTHPGAMDHLGIDDIDFDKLTSARHVHFSSAFLQPGIKKDLGRMFAEIKERGLTTSLDTQWDPAEKWDLDLASILPNVDVLLPNRQEAMHLTGANNIDVAIESLKSLGAKLIVVKMDNQGSIAYRPGEKVQLPAFLNTHIVDAIGAGDSFNAGFIHKYIQGKPLGECQKFANLTGAINTTAAGGTTAFVNREQIFKIAKEKFGFHE